MQCLFIEGLGRRRGSVARGGRRRHGDGGRVGDGGQRETKDAIVLGQISPIDPLTSAGESAKCAPGRPRRDPRRRPGGRLVVVLFVVHVVVAYVTVTRFRMLLLLRSTASRDSRETPGSKQGRHAVAEKRNREENTLLSHFWI